MASELEVGGVSSTTAKLGSSAGSAHGDADDLIIGNGSSTNAGITFNTPSAGGYLYFADGSSGDDLYRGFIKYVHSGNAMELGTNAATRLSIASTGAVDIAGAASHATALTVGNSTGGTELQVIPKENESVTLNSAEGVTAHALILATGGTPRLTVASTGLCTFANGINLGDTTLSNYAEGTFTPEAWDNDATQITCSVAVGRYVRVGKTVNISMRLTRNDATGFASNIYFRALPFTSQNVGSSTTYTKNIGGGSCWLPSDTRHGIAYALPGTTKVIFVDAKGADGGYIVSSEWANGNNLYASFTYEIA